MRKIKILFCIGYLAYGGTEKQLITLIRGLDPNKFEPHLCCINKSNIEKEFRNDALFLFRKFDKPKILLDFSSFRNINTSFCIVKLAWYIKKQKIDLIVSYFIDPTILSFISSKLSLRKSLMIINFRDLGLLRAKQKKLLMKPVYRQTPFFIANSEAVKSDYCNFDEIPSQKIHIIYNGVDTFRFSNIIKKNLEPFEIGIIANLNRPVKKVDLFLQAAAEICQNQSNVSFVVVGEGQLRPELIKMCKKLGISDKVNFVGRVYKIEKYLSRFYIGVNSSESEGFANVILEYLASGIPVVAADTGGNREVIKDNFNGFLFPVGDYKALADILMQIINDENLYSEISKNCRKSVAHCFDNSVMIENHEKFFKKIFKKLDKRRYTLR